MHDFINWFRLFCVKSSFIFGTYSTEPLCASPFTFFKRVTSVMPELSRALTCPWASKIKDLGSSPPFSLAPEYDMRETQSKKFWCVYKWCWCVKSYWYPNLALPVPNCVKLSDSHWICSQDLMKWEKRICEFALGFGVCFCISAEINRLVIPEDASRQFFQNSSRGRLRRGWIRGLL